VSRADKIWLGIAIALVVAMAAGVGVLLSRRSDTLAAERSKPKVAQVTLSKISTSPVAPKPVPKPTPTPPPNPIPQPPAPGAPAGFITKVTKTDAGFTLSFDPGLLTVGDEAVMAANKAQTTPTNGWFVANETHVISDYAIDPKAVIVVENPQAAPPAPSTLTPQQFRDLFPDGDKEDRRVQNAPFWIVLKGETVVRVEELHGP
jgi:hypothetical protein